MADLTRRGFLAQTAVTGVGIAGGLGLREVLFTPGQADTQAPPVPAVSAASVAAPSPVNAPAGLSLDQVALDGPMVLHIRDVANAEVSMMIGTQELLYRDPELVSRLVKTAASAGGRAEG